MPTAIPPDRPTASVGPLTLARLQSIWPDIVERARATSPMVGALLAGARVIAVDGHRVTLASGGQTEGLEHKRDGIAKLLREWIDGEVRVHVAADAGGNPAHATPPRATRLTEETANAERLNVLRAKDPSLGAAVDALDLELLE